MNGSEAIERYFGDVFQIRPDLITKAPGRFNLIGEHTDYNLGWVMPGAIDKYIFWAIGPGTDSDKVEIFAADLGERAQFRISEKGNYRGNFWLNYVRAVVSVLEDSGFPVPGFRAVMGGNIPIGAGLSSSAALCCGLISALSSWKGWAIPQRHVAKMAQSAEHLVGLNCGLMDQYAVIFGKAGNLLHLDCRSLEFDYLEKEWGEEIFLLFNSGVNHALAANDGYNERRASCERVVEVVQKKYPEVISLRDVSAQMLSVCKFAIPPVDLQRASYVLDENLRVEQAVKAVQSGDIALLGQILCKAHRGLRDDYRVTCPETDLLVDLAMAQSGVWGARQVGGGFGGCVLVLADFGKKDEIISTLTQKYAQKTEIFPTLYEFSISNGIEIEKNSH